MCLLALAVTIKPLANEIANHIRSDRHKDVCEDFQCVHLPSVARVKKGSEESIPNFDRICNNNKNAVPGYHPQDGDAQRIP